MYFRELEEKYISKILFKKNYVISLGGGVMNNINLRKILKQNSLNVYLYVSNSDLVKRLENSNKRPLIKNKKIISSTIIRKLLEEGNLSKANTFLKRKNLRKKTKRKNYKRCNDKSD